MAAKLCSSISIRKEFMYCLSIQEVFEDRIDAGRPFEHNQLSWYIGFGANRYSKKCLTNQNETEGGLPSELL